MKIHVLSDLHLEVEPFSAPRTDADVIVLAGDIGLGTKGIEWAASQAAFRDKPVLYVPGNHEFYWDNIDEGLGSMRAAARRHGVRLLDNETVDIRGVRFIGATLWTDFRLFGDNADAQSRAMREGASLITDFSVIRNGDGWFSPCDSVGLHQVSRRFIEAALAEQFAGPRVVITHHAPSLQSIAPRWAGDLATAGFASRLDDLVVRPNLWIHGHTHNCVDYMAGVHGRVVCNARGYFGERTGFDPAFVVEVPCS